MMTRQLHIEYTTHVRALMKLTAMNHSLRFFITRVRKSVKGCCKLFCRGDDVLCNRAYRRNPVLHREMDLHNAIGETNDLVQKSHTLLVPISFPLPLKSLEAHMSV